MIINYFNNYCVATIISKLNSKDEAPISIKATTPLTNPTPLELMKTSRQIFKLILRIGRLNLC